MIDDGTIRIEWGALKVPGGWAPWCAINGHETCDRYPPRTKEESREWAESYARYEASRYGGDWDITVTDVGEVGS